MKLTAEYKQDSRGSYLIVPIRAESGGYKEEMLVNNDIPGLLPAKAQELDEKHQLWYEWTGKMTLKERFCQKAPGTKEICELFRQIEETGRAIEDYFLEMDDLILDLEYIFTEGNQAYAFLCLPEYQQKAGKQLEQLLEALMECVDYKNRKAVSLVYLLHARSRKKEGGFLSLWQLCNEILYSEEKEKHWRVEETMEESKEENAKKALVPRKDAVERAVRDRGAYKKTGGARAMDACAEGKSAEPRKKGWKERLKEILKSLLGRAAEAMQEEYGAKREENEELAGMPEVVRSMEITQEQESKWDFFSPDIPNKEAAAHMPDTMLLMPEAADTVLLSEKEPEYCLKPLEKEKETIRLSGFPFFFGKEKTHYCYMFREPVISRRHAKIQREGAECYLTDMSSLNGTFLNGERLPANESRKLTLGDILGFADIFYLFVDASE